MQIFVASRGHPLRSRVERFIADVYRDHYSASVTSFPLDLIAALNSQGQCICAAGLRFAQGGFFSESYLDTTIEQALSAAVEKPVHRSNIFEVTSLASRAPRSSTLFLRHIVLYGELAGFDWAFFTATDRLRELLGLVGLPPLALASAIPQRVPNWENWGSYYTAAPVVCAINRNAATRFLSHQTRRAAYA